MGTLVLSMCSVLMPHLLYLPLFRPRMLDLLNKKGLGVYGPQNKEYPLP